MVPEALASAVVVHRPTSFFGQVVVVAVPKAHLTAKKQMDQKQTPFLRNSSKS